MYKCYDCESVFDFPITITEEYECYGRPSFDTLSGCPFCFGCAIEAYDPDDCEELCNIQ